MREDDWKEKLRVHGNYNCTIEEFRKVMKELITALKKNDDYHSFHEFKRFHLYYLNKKIDQHDYATANMEINFLLYVYCYEISTRYPFFELRLNHPKHYYGAAYFTNPNNGYSMFPLNAIYKAVYSAEDDVLESLLEAIEIYNRNASELWQNHQ